MADTPWEDGGFLLHDFSFCPTPPQLFLQLLLSVEFFELLLCDDDGNDIDGREGRVRVDLRSALLLLEMRLGKFTIWACFGLTPGTAGSFLIGRLVMWLRQVIPPPTKVSFRCCPFWPWWWFTPPPLIEGEDPFEDPPPPTSWAPLSFSFVLNVLPLWMPLSSVIVPWLEEEHDLKQFSPNSN